MKARISGRALRAALAAAGLVVAGAVRATPSSTFCTPATTSSQAPLVPHLTYDTYFSERGALQIDTGVTVGLPLPPQLAVEIGVDVFHPTWTTAGQLGTLDFAQLNAKLTVPEGTVFAGAPGVSVGIANVGFKKDVSNFDLAYAVLGKTTRLGWLGLGAYRGLGSKRLWLQTPDQDDSGVLAAYVSPSVNVGAAGLDRIAFLGDFATGKNWFGASGVAVALWFTPAIALKTGPVFFMDREFYDRRGLSWWVWSVQLDVDVDLRRRTS